MAMFTRDVFASRSGYDNRVMLQETCTIDNGEFMLKRYFVAHDDSITEWEPVFVDATSADAAVGQYMLQIYSKDLFFRQHVQELHDVGSFVGGLVFSTEEEKIQFMNGDCTRTPEFVQRRIRNFFEDAPELGEKFWKYVETEDARMIDEAIFEFIASRDTDGIVAIEEAQIRVLVPR